MVAISLSSRPQRLSSKLEGTLFRSPVIAVLQPQPILRAGLERVVSGLVEGAEVQGCAGVAEVLGSSRFPHVDMVITEFNLRSADCSLSCLERLRKALPKAQILILSALSERQFGLAALRAGANGFLPMAASLEELGKAIHAMLSGAGYISSEMAAVVADEAQGKSPQSGFGRLSPRELDVIRHLIWGMQLKAIATTLGLNIRTASCYKRNALSKLGMNSIAEVVRYSSEQGLTV
jgi:DNA-binding NarL/FixJ family response regulator